MSELNQIVGHLAGVRESVGVGKTKTKPNTHLVSDVLCEQEQIMVANVLGGVTGLQGIYGLPT